jgi:hypothetical protein
MFREAVLRIRVFAPAQFIIQAKGWTMTFGILQIVSPQTVISHALERFRDVHTNKCVHPDGVFICVDVVCKLYLTCVGNSDKRLIY